MIINKISLINFRNYHKLDINLGKNMNIFVGDNAQGKSNFLESISILGLTKSYRVGVEDNLIAFGSKRAIIKGKVKNNNISKNLEVSIENGKKRLMVNKTDIKRVGDYISNLNVIVFNPDDLEIIKGSPSIRRNLLNLELSQISKTYLNTYNEYNKLLKMRNEYLKLLLTSSLADKKFLDVITDKLIEKAIIIYKERFNYVNLINNNIDNIYKKIMGVDGLRVEYRTNITFDDIEDDEVMKKNMRRIFHIYYKKELNYGMTLYGPHRDDFSFCLNSNDLKLFGSQGQQKVAIIAYKLSEIDIFKDLCNSTPVLLLDDIFSELDIKKRNKLFEFISDNIQSIITTTDIKNIRKKNIENANIYNVKSGNIERRLK